MKTEEPTPTPRYIRFDHDRKIRWKAVPVSYVAMIANRSCKGADWTGSNKGDIIDGFEKVKNWGYTVDRDRFGELMDKAAKAMKKVRAFEDETMGQIFKTP
jgi:hypothetical protein